MKGRFRASAARFWDQIMLSENTTRYRQAAA
jgi:hypothetical protein